MFYSGFADEAGSTVDAQIKATKALGWSNIEARKGGLDLAYMSDAEFEEAFAKLNEAGVKINCFGSAVANWGKSPISEEDFQTSINELKTAFPRMRKLGTKMLRGMSFKVLKDEVPDAPHVEKQIFEKVNYLVKMCEDEGVIYGHENCMNYGGMSYKHTLKLLDNVKSDNFKLIFDTGNPVFTDLRIGEPPYKKQSSWEFYENVKEFIAYVHIKDQNYIGESGETFPKARFTFPGEGDGDVKRIVADLLKNGYDGGFSMEPHMAIVFHEDKGENEEEARLANYIEYGKRFMALVEEVRPK